MRVLTLTCNLLAETTYTFDRWSEGETQRARAELFQVGGKGINVTRMLTRLGIDSLALCFPGGPTGGHCEAWLRARALPHRSFPTPAATRSGAVVRAPGRPETTFLGTENDIAPTAIAACAGFLDAQPAGGLLAIGGSIPAWADARWDPLRAAVERWPGRGTLVADTYGPPLPWIARLPLALVKINRKEFAGLAGVEPRETTDARMPELLAAAAGSHRAARWVVTDGPHAVWFCARDGQPQSLTPPKVEEVSQTGSGDVLMASLLYALEFRRLGLKAAVEFAMPLAAANAASPDIAEFDLAQFGLAATR